MTKITSIVLGGEAATLTGKKGQYTLLVRPIETATQEEMLEYIKNLRDELHDIQWEIDSAYGALSKLEDKPEQEVA